MPAKSVILVHGAWADGSSWSKVILRLKEHGIGAVAVQLPLTRFEDDVATVRRALAIADGPVVLAGHSYGGSLITETGLDDKVKGLVYVAAFAPDANESAISLGETLAAAPLASEVRPDSEGFLKLTEAGVAEHFAQDLPKADQSVLYAAQGPTAVASLAGQVGEPAWQCRPSWYVLASEDHAIAPQLQRIMSDRMLAKVTQVASSHLAMLSHPDIVTSVIMDAVNGT